MKKILFCLLIIITHNINSIQAQEENLVFESELAFLHSWYGIDAIIKFRRTIHPILAEPAQQYADEFKRLRTVDEFPNRQQALYKKYETIGTFFDTTYCLLPRYFHKKANGTYTLMYNFVDLGFEFSSEYVDPKNVCKQLLSQINPIINVICLGVNQISKTEISSVGFSFVYKAGGYPRTIAFWTNKQNYLDCYNGKITLDELHSKCRIYHSKDIHFLKVQ